jgi:hypothetical protein
MRGGGFRIVLKNGSLRGFLLRLRLATVVPFVEAELLR